MGNAEMVEWVPIWVMPNLRLREAIEARRAALVPFDDYRIAELVRKHRRFNSFMLRFTDAFGVPQRPAVLLARKRSKITAEAMASFRDLVVLSVVPYNRAQLIVYGRGSPRILFSNSFWLYPWMLEKNYEWLITQSLASLGLNEIRRFKGQVTPEIFPIELNPVDIDKTLLTALIQRWRRRYFEPKPTWEDRALFRSLNMANIGCHLPSIVDTTLFDYGRTLALWVSAFEILVHPGNAKANQAAVNSVLDQIPYFERAMRHKAHPPYDPNVKKVTRTILARAAYAQLYSARNHFLHREPVSRRSLRLKGARAHLTDIAPSLYRLALTAVLDLRFTETAPPTSDLEAYLAFRRRFSEFHDGQHMHERALLKLRKTRTNEAPPQTDEVYQPARVV
jgi:hypothetical protein